MSSKEDGLDLDHMFSVYLGEKESEVLRCGMEGRLPSQTSTLLLSNKSYF